MLGFVALILPGIYIATRLSVTEYVYLLVKTIS